MLTIYFYFGRPYVYRELTEADIIRYIGNGYIPPSRERENDPSVYQYARGQTKPNYPVPAIHHGYSNPRVWDWHIRFSTMYGYWSPFI